MSRHSNPNAIEGQPCLRGDILLKSAGRLDKLTLPGSWAVTSPSFINGAKKFAIENIPVGDTPGDIIQVQRPFDVGYPDSYSRTLTDGTWSAWTSLGATIAAVAASAMANVVTPLGGITTRMVNGTGGASVKGMVVSVSTSADNKFIAQANEYDAFGIVYEDGVADGQPVRIVVSGVAEVLLKDGSAATRGHVALSADTDGRMVTIAVPSSNPVVGEHFKEIGHCCETKNAGTNVLVKCVIHFN